MKKLMIAVSVVAMAMASQAVQWKWGASTGALYNGTAEQKITSGATAYLFDAGTYDQSKFLTAFLGGSSVADLWSANGVKTAPTLSINGTNSNFPTPEGQFSYGEAGSKSFYAVIVADDMAGRAYISASVSASASDLGAGTISIGSLTKPSKKEFDTATTFGNAGWYGAVPEPTSGLLLLLGVAGLALRRRRA